MKNHLSPAWIIGFLLAVPSIVLVNCEEKVKRQLSREPLVIYGSVPKTSFSCDLVGPGYYADIETECQIFHVCHANIKHSFICPGGTSFNQKVFVCDWRANVDCDSSPSFYSLNSRIGSDEPFLTSPFVSVAAWRIDGSTERIARIDAVPDGQLGSPSQARVKTVKPDSPVGKLSGSDTIRRTASNIRVGNTLLPNTLFVEVPTFVAKEAEISERPTTETSESPAETTIKPPDAFNSRQKTLSRRRGGEKQKKKQTYGSRLREQGYLPESTQKKSSGKAGEKDEFLLLDGSGEGPSSPERGGYLPLEGSDDGASAAEKNDHSPQKKGKGTSPSRERGSYLPTEGSNVLSTTSSRGSYLPEVTPDVSSSTTSRGSYLPEEGTDDTTGQPDSGSNSLAEKPPQSGVTDLSFLLPPPSFPELPNSILGAFALPTVDEYSPVPPTTAAPRLPPMNLLPLSNESAPPTKDSRLPSTTESYGVLDEDEAETTERSTVPPRSRQGFGRALRRRPKVGDQGKNAIPGGKKTTQKPATEAATIETTTEFQYDFDRVRDALQGRLRDIEPFDVPVGTAATSDGTTVAPPSGSTRSGGVAPSAWLYSLSRVPM